MIAYVGETDRVLRGREYEPKVIDHKTATRTASINHPEDKKRQPTRPQQITQRKSTRIKTRLQSSEQWSKPTTNRRKYRILSSHGNMSTHARRFTIQSYMDNNDWFKTEVKEAIAIRNKDGG